MRVQGALGLFAVTVALGAQTSARQRVVPPVPNQLEHTLEAENASVRIYRVKLDPGDSIPVHTHAAGWIAVTITGPGGPGTYRWYAAGAANPITAGMYPLEVVELEPR